MKKMMLLGSLFLSLQVFSQEDIARKTDSIKAEADQLYRSEMASWYGTDIFLAKFKDKQADAGGYFSYPDGAVTRCLFFTREENPSVLADFTFDSSFSINSAITSDKRRAFSTREKELYDLRKAGMQIINDDTFFVSYKNTNLNIIPLIDKGAKKIYVLTGPSISNVVVFGNDYLLTFNEKNELLQKKRLHKNIIDISYGKEKEGEEIFGTMHSHLPETGDFMTATDLCTLMLYAKFTKWKQHIVISEKYVSIWDIGKQVFFAITREAWEKIRNDK